ncbi:unnamed protein product, partial [marine sediment metagenome]
MRRTPKKEKLLYLDLRGLEGEDRTDSLLNEQKAVYILQESYLKTAHSSFISVEFAQQKDLVPLEEIMDCKDAGIKHQRVGVGLEEKFKTDIRQRLFYKGKQKDKRDILYIDGKDLDRYRITYKNEKYLRENFKSLLKGDEIVYFNKDYFSASVKMLWRQTADRPIASIDVARTAFANTLQVGVIKPSYDKSYSYLYILSIFNFTHLTGLYRRLVQEEG